MEDQVGTQNDELIEIEENIAEEEDYERSPAEYNISTYPADYTLEVLYQKWVKGEIKIPAFQRKFVWSQSQSSKLIESFLVGLPVPAVYLYIERNSQHYLVIDGQQRLRSIFYFIEGYFGEGKGDKRTIFKLKGLSKSSKWNNLTYEDFEDADALKLKNSVLRSFIITQLEPDDNTSIYHIFERLNRGGTLLSNQEIRNCIYESKFNQLLITLNENADWRMILGKPKPDKRLRDVELIIRFLSLLDISKYTPPMKDYFSKFMYKHKIIDADQLDSYEKIFNNTCNAVIQNLGEKPFHIIKGINTAVLDSVMVSFSKHIAEIPSNIREKYNRLLKESKYKEVITGPVPNKNVVEKRFKIAEEMLFN